MRNPRRHLLALVHVARRDLRLDEESWRALVRRTTGHDSCRDASVRQLRTLLGELERLGFRRRPPARAGRERLGGARRHRMARGLWIELWKAGVVRDPSERALDAFTRRVTGVDSLVWTEPEQTSLVIEALKDMAERNGVPVRA